MKSSNVIKLLAALLCVVMMFVSCADSAVIPETNGVDSLSGTAGTFPTLSDTTGTEDVAPTEPLKLSDFIEFIDKDKVYTTVEDAPEGVVDVYENYYLIYDYSVDAMNQATYSYEVVNIETGESYKKWEHTFDQANPDSEIYVHFETAGNVAIIAVADVKYAEITDAMRDESYLITDSDRYYIDSISYDVYDLYGNTVFENKPFYLYESIEFSEVEFSSNHLFGSVASYVLNVCDGSYYLFDKDGKFDKAIEATSTEMFAFDYENDTYGYYLRAEHYDDYAIQVYEKATGKLVYYKVYESFMESGEEGAIVNVLNDGTIFIQEIRPAYAGEAYDFHTALLSAMNGAGEDGAYMLDSYTLKLSNADGKFQATETPVDLDYLYLYVLNADSIRDTESTEDIVLGEKAVNLGIGLKINDRAISIENSGVMGALELVFIDNDLKVQYVPETIVPLSDAFVYEKLDNGYSYVTISFGGNQLNALYNPEGEFVRYLGTEHMLMNDFIVNGYGIFDYGFNCLYEFEENESIACRFGDSLIISEYTEDDPDTSYDEEEEVYYRLTLKLVENAKTEESTENTEGTEGGEDTEEEAKPTYTIDKKELKDILYIAQSSNNNDDYIVLYNGEDETFNLYNRDFECLFISMNAFYMQYNDYLDAYMMHTQIKGENRYYIVK